MWCRKLSEETVTFNLELNVEQCLSNIRRMETLLFRTLGLLRRLSGNESIDAAISKIQRLVMIIRLTHSAILLLEKASGPIGWAFAIVGISTAVVSMSDFALGE